MGISKQHLTVALPFVPILIIIIFLAWLVYPGGWSPDTWAMWNQVVGLRPYSDSKPIAMKLVWKAVSFFPFYGGILLVQVLIYFSAIAAFCVALFSSMTSQAVASLLIGVFPPVLYLNLTIWIDVIAYDLFFFFFEKELVL